MTSLRSSFDREALSALLCGLESKETIRGVQHPNGFLRVMIEQVVRKGTQLRVHMWKRGSSDSDIHNHCWPFDSLCIRGALRMKQFQTESHGQKYDRYTCRSVPDVQGRAFVLTKCGTEGLIKIGDRWVRAGDHYRMSPEDLHKIELDTSSDECCTITIVRRGPYVKGETDLYLAPRDHSHVGATFEKAVTFTQIEKEVAIIKESIRQFL